ncbi:MAG: hypothetical protein AB1758_21235, partial [Candidatus Eremiobacterota bacterium]
GVGRTPTPSRPPAAARPSAPAPAREAVREAEALYAPTPFTPVPRGGLEPEEVAFQKPSQPARTSSPPGSGPAPSHAPTASSAHQSLEAEEVAFLTSTARTTATTAPVRAGKSLHQELAPTSLPTTPYGTRPDGWISVATFPTGTVDSLPDHAGWYVANYRFKPMDSVVDADHAVVGYYDGHSFTYTTQIEGGRVIPSSNPDLEAGSGGGNTYYEITPGPGASGVTREEWNLAMRADMERIPAAYGSFLSSHGFTYNPVTNWGGRAHQEANSNTYVSAVLKSLGFSGSVPDSLNYGWNAASRSADGQLSVSGYSFGSSDMDLSQSGADLSVAALRAANRAGVPVVPLNTEAALYSWGRSNGKGYAQTDEIQVVGPDGTAYVGQVFESGIAYVRPGDWGNVRFAAKNGNSLPGSPAVSGSPYILPLNGQGALYKGAAAHELGQPQSDEFHFVQDGVTYVGQFFEGGLVYTVPGQWDASQIRFVVK